VIGNHFQVARPEIKVGDTINISFDGKETEWVIVGSVKMAFNVVPPIVYTNKEYLQHTLGQANRVGEIRISTSEHTLETQQRVADQLEQIFEAKGIQFNSAALGVEILQQNTAQTDILVAFMLVMAVLVAIVGGLGLASTMSMNVLERTREIGVIRAIGASDFSVLSMVVVEGLFVGVLSWLIGSILSIPIGIGLNYAVGMGFWQTPLDFVFAWDGVLVWLAMVVIISAVASFIPARNATRLTVREVLAYE
jgi:putative ABC transport system permease protein